jgi:hypothetical protein
VRFRLAEEPVEEGEDMENYCLLNRETNTPYYNCYDLKTMARIIFEGGEGERVYSGDWP